VTIPVLLRSLTPPAQPLKGLCFFNTINMDITNFELYMNDGTVHWRINGLRPPQTLTIDEIVIIIQSDIEQIFSNVYNVPLGYGLQYLNDDTADYYAKEQHIVDFIKGCCSLKHFLSKAYDVDYDANIDKVTKYVIFLNRKRLYIDGTRNQYTDYLCNRVNNIYN